MVVEKYRLVGSDYALLAIAFPNVPWVRAGMAVAMSFVTAKRLIVFSEDDLLPQFSDAEVIQIASTAAIALNTRNGFLRFLASKGVRPTRYQLRQMLVLDDWDFWQMVKRAWLLKSFSSVLPKTEADGVPTMLDLFNVFFEDFGEVYRLYERMRSTWRHKQIISGLITMMIKTQNYGRRTVSPYYSKVLAKNAKYIELFRQKILDYLESEMNEIDFLSFAAACTQHTRPPDL
jgi:hypothetical protein